MLAMHCLLHEACDEAVPVQQLRTVHTNYGARNNKINSQMWVTQDRVHIPSPHVCVVRRKKNTSDGRQTAVHACYTTQLHDTPPGIQCV